MTDSEGRSSNMKSTSEVTFALDSGATDHFVKDANIFNEAAISIKFENNRAVISKDKFFLGIAQLCGNIFQLKLQVAGSNVKV